MEKISDLSIADLKAALDYVQEIKKERYDDLHKEGVDALNDVGIIKLENLQFDFVTALDEKIMRYSR